jgi:prevent-host-death family protein
MLHRTQDTYPLSHFRQHTTEHVQRVKDGAVETITQNGEAAFVVMSPETYDELMNTLFRVHAAERGHIWDDAIEQIEKGDYGRDAREVIHAVADKHGLKL